MNNQIKIDEETANELRKLTKQELIEKFAVAALEAETYKLRCQTAIEAEYKAHEKVKFLKKSLDEERAKLGKAESYVEQGRAMVTAVMERWYEYDE